MDSKQNFKYFVGIDISKNSFDATIIDEDQKKLFYQKFSMNIEGFKNFVKNLKKFDKTMIKITAESTGVYFVNLYNYLIKKGFNVSVVNPLLIHNFHKSMSLRKMKTDKRDSFVIAVFTLKNLEFLRKNSKQSSTLKHLCREENKLSEEISKIKTEMKSDMSVIFPELEQHCNIFTKSMLLFLSKHSAPESIRQLRKTQIENIFKKTNGNKVKMTAEFLKKLAKESVGSGDKYLEMVINSKIQRLELCQKLIEEFDAEIQEFVDKNLSKDFEILTSIKGIGHVTAQKFLIEIDDINNFNNHKQLTAYIGTDPTLRQSGSSIMYEGKISKRGNKYLRKTIYQMAVNCIRNEGKLKDYYEKKRSEDKKYKQAIIAVGNKLLRIIFAMLTKRTQFSESY